MTARFRMTPAAWAAGTLGFAMGGFFDGILLHQVLQWHHLLSGVEAAQRDLSFLVMADGLFHLAMYGVAALGLVLLWRARSELAPRGSGAKILAMGLIGFGFWHVVDAVFSHWLLGIHRIRMDAANPLYWDLLWLGLFGVTPLAVGLGMIARRGATTLRCPIWAVGFAVLLAGGWAGMPPRDQNTAIVVFHPGMSAQNASATVLEANSRLLWTDASGSVWAVALSEDSSPFDFYRGGALLVGTGWFAGACLNWTLPDQA